MKRQIKTIEELRELDGKKITCIIDGTQVDDCLVSIQFDEAQGCNKLFLLQNKKNGRTAQDLKGYKYAWSATEGNIDCLECIYYETIEDEYLYGKVINYEEFNIKKPDWIKDDIATNPILVHYSDLSEEYAKEDGEMGLCLGYVNSSPDYPFVISDISDIYAGNYESIEDFLEAVKDLEHDYKKGNTRYAYAVPVKLSDFKFKEEVKAESKELTKEEQSVKIGSIFVDLGKDKLEELLELMSNIR